MRNTIKEDMINVKTVILNTLGESGSEEIERMGGLTNRTYKVRLSNGGYLLFVFRVRVRRN